MGLIYEWIGLPAAGNPHAIMHLVRCRAHFTIDQGRTTYPAYVDT